MTSVRPVLPLRHPFDITLPLPGSKSVANRSLVAAALGEGACLIRNASPCDDVLRMIAGLRTLGFGVEDIDVAKGHYRIQGGLPSGGSGRIDCGNAGTTLRFLISVAALVPGEWTLDGNEYMRTRPIADLVAAWRELGLEIDDTEGCPPVRLRGGTATKTDLCLRASLSSQYLSSLLLSGASLPEGLKIVLDGPLASSAYVDVTLDVLRQFGVHVEARDGHYRVSPGRGSSPSAFEVEGDWSSAGPWLVLEEMTHSRFRAPSLNPSSRQSDRLVPNYIDDLRGDGDRELNVEPIPDQLMNLAVLAARRLGRTRFVGAANLRHKECDRLAVTARELARMGIHAEVEPDGLLITGSRKARASAFDPEDDHRMAMAFALVGSLLPETTMSDAGCVAKSYPEFFAHLDAAQKSPRCLALIGMRAAGKTELGQSFAAAEERAFIDTDERFRELHGPIDAFVAAKGWEAFRRREAEIVCESLAPGRVVALGGGAIESARVRDAITEEALGVFVDEDTTVLQRRLEGSSSHRPSLTGKPLDEELAEIYAQRRPLYEALADIRLSPGFSQEARIAELRRCLQDLCRWS